MFENSENHTIDMSSVLSPNQHRALSSVIFSGSTHKSTKARNSEKRYSKPAQAFDKIDLNENIEEVKTGKLLTYEEASKTKHRRKSSIDELAQDKKFQPKVIIKHSRNVSDADSVIYRQTDEDLHKRLTISTVKCSLPVLEGTPCTFYCRFCVKQVHTVVDIYSNKISKKILSWFASFVSCCQVPVWLNDMKVHKCPHCSLVLARVGIPNVR